MSTKNASLLGACLCSLSAGIVYAFSLYGPQLQEKYLFSQTQTNTISLCGNMGVYLSSPLFGYWADKYGARKVGFFAPFAYLIGFLSLSLTFNYVDHVYYWVLAFYSFIVGLGCGCSYMCAIVVAGHNFKKSRGFGIGIPVVFYGISGFMFSSCYTLFFVYENSANTGGFLTFLAISNFIFTLVGTTLLVKIDYVPISDSAESNEQTERVSVSEVDIHGWALFHNLDARLLFFCILSVAGSGLMYINNIGNMLHSLDVLDPVKSLPNLRSLNVSTISILNCLGRLFVAMTSDYVLKKWEMRRINFFLFSAIIMAFCQYLNAYTSTTWKMTINSALTGFAYGIMFAIAPTMVSDWFGSIRFGSNWGWMNLAPAGGAQVGSLLFGLTYDSHVKASKENSSLCKLGVGCYSTAFIVTGILCILAIITLIILKKRRLGYYF